MIMGYQSIENTVLNSQAGIKSPSTPHSAAAELTLTGRNARFLGKG